MITMTLCGLWHGAAWPYVVFGVIQGTWLCLHRFFRQWCRGRPTLDRLLQTPGGTALRVAGTFVTFCLTLVIFRTATLAAGFTMLGRMFRSSPGLGSAFQTRSLVITFFVVLGAHFLAQDERWKKVLASVPPPVRGFGYAAVLTLALVLAPEADKAFIYFQ